MVLPNAQDGEVPEEPMLAACCGRGLWGQCLPSRLFPAFPHVTRFNN